MTQLPFFDIQAQHQPIRAEIDRAIAEVIDSGRFIRGSFVERFEAEIAAYLGTPHAIGVSSGTDALLAALMALEIGPGDEVITTPFTFCASAEVILRVGATPVFVDIDPATFNLDADLLNDALSDNTRAVMPVHIFGQTCEMDKILAFARQHDLYVIEDCAQAMGATFDLREADEKPTTRQAGTMGDVGCFSFFPTKNLGALGDGGLITCDDPELAERVRLLCNHGCQPKYRQQMIGGNFRLDALQAAVLSVKLNHLEAWITQRRDLAGRYHQVFGALDAIVLPGEAKNRRHTYNQYTLRARDRLGLQKRLAAAGIPTAIYYRESLHQMPPYLGCRRHPDSLPNATRACDEALSLPIVGDSIDLFRLREALQTPTRAADR